jgi:large subunit ribosomal protein L33
MQCATCGDLNYRTEIKVVGGVQKIELKKYCPRERIHTHHKMKRK